MPHDLGAVRRLVRDALASDEDLLDVAFYDFTDVHAMFTTGQTHPERLRLLLTHAESQQRIEKLIDSVRKKNPNVYAEYEASAGRPAPPPGVSKEDEAHRVLTKRGVKIDHESLFLYIRSANHEIVRLLLEAGVSPNVEVDGQTPLQLALSQIGSAPSIAAPTADFHVSVLRAVVCGGETPRGLGLAAHHCLKDGKLDRLRALRLADVPLDAKDDRGQSLAVQAMRQDEQNSSLGMPGGFGRDSICWTEQLLRVGPPPSHRLAAWMLLWASSNRLLALVERLLKGGLSPDARLDDAPPDEDIAAAELPFWSAGGTALHYAIRSTPITRLLIEKGATRGATNRRGETALHMALRDGRTDVALALVAGGAGLTVADQDGDTPLSLAVGNASVFEAMVKTGVEIPATDLNTLFHAAVGGPHEASLRLLLQKGADPNARNADGQHALTTLAQRIGGSLLRVNITAWQRCLELLIAHKVDINAATDSGWTILHELASTNAPVDVVEKVVRAGVDLEARTEDGNTPLMFCKGELATLLLRLGAKSDARNRFGYGYADWRHWDDCPVVSPEGEAPISPTPEAQLASAVRNKRPLEVAELLDAGVAPNTLDGYGSPVVHSAPNFELLKLLLDRGTDVDARDSGDTLLGRALSQSLDFSSEENQAAIQLLLDREANVAKVRKSGDSALHLAAANGYSAVVKRLLDIGTDVDSRDPVGMTPLGRALGFMSTNLPTGREYEATLQLLLDRGATVTDIDKHGRAAVFIGSRWWYHPDLARRLTSACQGQRGPMGETILMLAVEWGSLEQVKALSRFYPVDELDAKGRTALFRAADRANFYAGYRDGYYEKAEFLLWLGAAVNLTDHDGDTPLMVAASKGFTALTRLLLDRGAANPCVRNKKGQSALDIALSGSESDMVNLLRRAESEYRRADEG